MATESVPRNTTRVRRGLALMLSTFYVGPIAEDKVDFGLFGTTTGPQRRDVKAAVEWIRGQATLPQKRSTRKNNTRHP